FGARRPDPHLVLPGHPGISPVDAHHRHEHDLNDYNYTGLVFRLEQSFSTKDPRQFSTNSPERLQMQKEHCPPNALGFPECTGAAGNIFNAAANTSDFATRAKRYAQVWRSMVGADWTSSIASSYAHKIHNEL